MAAQVGMSRAVFHRKFKQATTMSPIQFVKSMRLNNAAMKIAGGLSYEYKMNREKYSMTSSVSAFSDRKYDIAIAGGGSSGLSATLTAVENRLKVIVLEKMTFLGGAMHRLSALFSTNPAKQSIG